MAKNWLNNKTVIITGASGGIGFNVAKILIEKYNCKIIGIARNEEKLLKAIENIENKENFSYKIFDVSKAENWDIFKNQLISENIYPDVLINNAGFMLPFLKFENISDDEISEIVRTNFLSNLYSIKKLLSLLKKSKTPAIINVASAAGNCPVVGESMYCATKFAVKGLTETLAQDYKKSIYVGGVYPGFIKTDILNRMSVKDKENKLISKMMKPAPKAAKIIVKGMKKKKRQIVMGVDGKLMSFFYRLFPKLTANIITFVLKKSKLELFGGVFDDKKGTLN